MDPQNQENQRLARNNKIKDEFVTLVQGTSELIETIKQIPRLFLGAVGVFIRQGNLLNEHIQIILAAIHRILPIEIRIVVDRAHNSWVCLHYVDAEEREDRRVNAWKFSSNELNNDHKRMIADLYDKPDWNALEYTAYRQGLIATRREDEFVFALAYGLCIAMGLDENAFQIGLDANQATQHVRNVIGDILMRGALPMNSANIWIP